MTRRQLLLSVPALAVARAAAGQAAAQIRVRTLSHFGLAVSDPKRSVDFYRNLFGLPIQARAGANTILRIGAGPQFISIGPAENAAPSINHFCLGIDNFNVDRIMAALAAHGVAKAAETGPMKAAVTMRDGTPICCSAIPTASCVSCKTALLRRFGTAGQRVRRGDIAAKGADCAQGSQPPHDLLDRCRPFEQVLPGPVRSLDPLVSRSTAPTLAVGPTVQFPDVHGGWWPFDRLRTTGGGAAPAAPPRPASINHGCFSLDGFKPDEVIKALESFGIKPREGTTGPVGPLRHYTSMRMENRGGAPEGTPELYFTDPDGLLMQLQDTTYCGGGGILGNSCK
jgi:catechol 2,3-dioxygenase-like lactoylglutathione lyase family enzyme